MLAIEIQSNSLTPTERLIPVPTANQVLIRVAAAGVNRADVMQRQGFYPPPAGAPDIPGLEVAGTIAAVGEKVTRWSIGEKVCALVSGGGYAQYCVADSSAVLPIPSGLNWIQAAGIPETFFTVWSNLFDRAHLTAGETLLIHGGSSGIGTTAIQVAKAFGNRVIITAGSDEKCLFCQSLGADFAINYRSQDFVTEINTITNSKGVDAILDMVGADYLARNLKCLNFDGCLIYIGLQSGSKSDINLLPILTKRLTLTGSTLRNREPEFKAAIAEKLLQQVWPLLSNQQLKPIIHSTFPLMEADKAHQLMESGLHFGKIILTV